MPPLYHFTVLPPKMPEAVAELQEINMLRGHFGGDLWYINPNQHSPMYVPRLLFGFQLLGKLRRAEAQLSLHHFYNPDAFAFPFLRWLKKPIIYAVSGGVGEGRLNAAFFNRMAAVAVPDERSLRLLQARGVTTGVQMRPGIDTMRFRHHPQPLTGEIRLLMASAPWTEAQFASKGIDALLEAVARLPRLHLTFLWRGVLEEEMRARVKRLNLQDRVMVINRRVDVNAVLAEMHGAVALANRPGIMKAYPHSLLDALAAGKPVLVNRAIPMADYVAESGCGVVIEEVNAESVLAAVEKWSGQYAQVAETARTVGQRDFSQQQFINAYEKLYARLTSNK
ncbi:MAG: glycosyltransferase [Caldilineaceae bacterium]|nr:glycosyltransferase [Caldilineaceae bacterium]